MALPLQQSTQFARALAANHVPLASREPVILKRRFGVLGAVSFASRVSMEGLAHRPKIINAEVDDPKRLRAANYHRIITPAHIARWNLTLGNRHAAMTGKWRNQLNKGLGAGLRVRELLWDGSGHWLIDQAVKLAKQRRYRTIPSHILSAYAHENPKDAHIFEAYDRGTPVAACLILLHGRSATYQTAWSSETGKTLQAPRVLLDYAAARLESWGYEDFDLGAVETDHAAGLARFKLGTGADLVRLGGTWIHIGRSRPLVPSHPMA